MHPFQRTDPAVTEQFYGPQFGMQRTKPQQFGPDKTGRPKNSYSNHARRMQLYA